MSKEKVLIAVKTYPTFSKSYDELVCTAGFREDGTFIRIYPIPYRKLDYDQRYKKYEWIALDLEKNTSDFRPESFKPVDIDTITNLEFIDTDKGTWERRKEICLKNVYDDMSLLIEEAKDRNICRSLAVFKPGKILEFIIEDDEKEWKKEEEIRIRRNQLDLFRRNTSFEIVKKLPYKFSYKFRDKNDRESKLMIADWEVGQLFWNCLEKHGSEEKACADVKKQYYDVFAEKDIYFFLGTTKAFHYPSKNPFMIIGVFYPKKDDQLKMF